MTTATLDFAASRTALRPKLDPRVYQILTLAGLLFYGATVLGFDVPPLHAAVIVVAALATQYAGGRAVGLPHFDAKSPLISALSLCLLLRTNAWEWAAAAA